MLTGGDKDALDNFCDSVDSVVVGMGLPRSRKLDPPVAGGGGDRVDHQPGDRPKSGVTTRAVVMLPVPPAEAGSEFQLPQTQDLTTPTRAKNGARRGPGTSWATFVP